MRYHFSAAGVPFKQSFSVKYTSNAFLPSKFYTEVFCTALQKRPFFWTIIWLLITNLINFYRRYAKMISNLKNLYSKLEFRLRSHWVILDKMRSDFKIHDIRSEKKLVSRSFKVKSRINLFFSYFRYFSGKYQKIAISTKTSHFYLSWFPDQRSPAQQEIIKDQITFQTKNFFPMIEVF